MSVEFRHKLSLFRKTRLFLRGSHWGQKTGNEGDFQFIVNLQTNMFNGNKRGQLFSIINRELRVPEAEMFAIIWGPIGVKTNPPPETF